MANTEWIKVMCLLMIQGDFATYFSFNRRNFGFLVIPTMFMSKLTMSGAYVTLSRLAAKNQIPTVRSARKERKLYTVSWRHLINDFSDLGKVC